MHNSSIAIQQINQLCNAAKGFTGVKQKYYKPNSKKINKFEKSQPAVYKYYKQHNVLTRKAWQKFCTIEKQNCA